MGSFQERLTLLKFFKVGLLLILWNGSAFSKTKVKWSPPSSLWNSTSLQFDVYEDMLIEGAESINEIEIPLTIICNEVYQNYSKVYQTLKFFEFTKMREYQNFFIDLGKSLDNYIPTLCYAGSACALAKKSNWYVLRPLLVKHGLFIFPTTLVLQPCRPPISTERMIVGPLVLLNAAGLIPKPTKGHCKSVLEEKLVAALIKNPLSKGDWIAAFDKYNIDRESCSSKQETSSKNDCFCTVNFKFHTWACKLQDEKAVETVLDINPERYGYAENYVFEVRWFCKTFGKEIDL